MVQSINAEKLTNTQAGKKSLKSADWIILVVFCCYKNRKKYFRYTSLYLTVRLINLSVLLLWCCSYPSRRLCAAISRTIQHNTHRVHRAHHRDYFNVCSSAEALLNTQTHSVLWVCEHWARQALSLKTTLQGKVVLSAFPKDNNNEWELLGLSHTG